MIMKIKEKRKKKKEKKIKLIISYFLYIDFDIMTTDTTHNTPIISNSVKVENSGINSITVIFIIAEQ